MKKTIITSTFVLSISMLAIMCNEPPASEENKQPSFGGYASQIDWGEHLVTVGGCHDCHTPKKMGPHGPVIDNSLMFAGHIAGSPEPDINKKEIQDKGLVVTNDLTTWIGPWGTSYAANLSSDATGIGNWKEEQLFKVFRQGIYKGLEGNRAILPPMPWEMLQHYSDDEIRAIFAYLKSTRPVNNVVPAPLPPVN